MINPPLNSESSGLFQGRYNIKHRIGVGKSGEIFSAYDKKTGSEVAIKILFPTIFEDSVRRSQLKHKLKLGMELSNPHIVKILDVDTDNKPYAIVMELLSGMTLRENITLLARANEGFDIQEIVRIGCSVCEGLTEVHRSTVHLNIKPENIFLCYDGTVKIMDLGVPRVPETSMDNSDSGELNKVSYIAPEQGDGTLTADRRADQYGLAVVLAEALSVPRESTESFLQGKCTVTKDRGILSVLARALSENPSDRYRDMHDFSIALQRVPRSYFLAKKIPILIIVTTLIFLATMGVKMGSEQLSRIFPSESLARDTELAKSNALFWRKRWYNLNSLERLISLQAKLAQENMERARRQYADPQASAVISTFQCAGDLYRAAVSALSGTLKRRKEADIARGKVTGIKQTIDDLLSDGYIGATPPSVAIGSDALLSGDGAYEDRDYIVALENYTFAYSSSESGLVEIQKQLSLLRKIHNIRQSIRSQTQAWDYMKTEFRIEESTEIDRAKIAETHADDSIKRLEFANALGYYEDAMNHYNSAISATAKHVNLLEDTSLSKERILKFVQVWDELVRNGRITDEKFASKLRQQISIGDVYFENKDYGNAKPVYDAVVGSLETELGLINERHKESVLAQYKDARVLLERWDDLDQVFSEKVEHESDIRKRAVLAYTLEFFASHLHRESERGISTVADLARSTKLISDKQYALAGVVLEKVSPTLTVLTDIAGQIDAPLREAYIAQRKADMGRAILGAFAGEISEVKQLFVSGDQLLKDGKEALSNGDPERAGAVFREAIWLYSMVFQQAPMGLMSYIKEGADSKNKELALAAFNKIRDYKPEDDNVPPSQDPPEYKAKYIETTIIDGRVRFNKRLLSAAPEVKELVSILGVKPRKWGRSDKVLIFDNLGITAYIRDDGSHLDEIRLYMSTTPSNGWSPHQPYESNVDINEHRIEPGQAFDMSVSAIAPVLIYAGVRVNSYGGINGNPNIHIVHPKDSRKIEYIRIGFE